MTFSALSVCLAEQRGSQHDAQQYLNSVGLKRCPFPVSFQPFLPTKSLATPQSVAPQVHPPSHPDSLHVELIKFSWFKRCSFPKTAMLRGFVCLALVCLFVLISFVVTWFVVATPGDFSYTMALLNFFFCSLSCSFSLQAAVENFGL